MFQVVKDIISSVSIDPTTSSDLSSSDPDLSDSDLNASFNSAMNLTSSQPNSHNLSEPNHSTNPDSQDFKHNKVGDGPVVPNQSQQSDVVKQDKCPDSTRVGDLPNTTTQPSSSHCKLVHNTQHTNSVLKQVDKVNTTQPTQPSSKTTSHSKVQTVKPNKFNSSTMRGSGSQSREYGVNYTVDYNVVQTNTVRIDDGVDEYLNGFLESIVRRFYHQEPFDEYSKVRDYNFGATSLELLSKFRGNTNLKEFIVNGVIDVPMENLLALVMELSNRTKWDDTYLEHQMLGFDEPSKTDFIFSVSKYPFPLTKRTYVVSRTCYSYREDCIVILSAATSKVPYPKRLRWATQVDEFESLLVVKNCPPEEVNGELKVTKAFMLATYFENPKVLLPNSYLNLIIGQLVPGILSKMIIASKGLNYQQSVDYVKQMILIPIPEDHNRSE